MPNPPACPECDIIILSYADIAAEAGEIQWKAQAIDDLYGTAFVQAKIKDDSALHQKVTQKLTTILRRLREDKNEMQAIIKELTGSPFADI